MEVSWYKAVIGRQKKTGRRGIAGEQETNVHWNRKSYQVIESKGNFSLVTAASLSEVVDEHLSFHSVRLWNQA